MSAAQRQLLQRFRASAVARLGRIAQQLTAHARGESKDSPLLEIARELHTLKGESRMLGLRALSSVVHGAETALEQAGLLSPELSRKPYEHLAQALDMAARVLQDDPGADAAYQEALQPALQELQLAEVALASPQPTPLPTPAAERPAASSASLRIAQAAAKQPPGPDAGGKAGSPSPPPASEASPERGKAEEQAPAAEPTEQLARQQDRWIQVKADRIDALCGTIAELSAGVRALRSHARRLVQSGLPSSTPAPATQPNTPANTELFAAPWLKPQPAVPVTPMPAAPPSSDADARSLLEEFERLQNQLEGIESAAWALRLVQIEPSLHDLARHTKDLAQASQKRVRVIVQTASVEIERPVLDTVWQPLLHILRNAIDHGIESPAERQEQNKPSEATIVLHAEAAGPFVLLTVTDDGRGIVREDVRRAAIARGLLPISHPPLTEQQTFDLLFQHGFSTRSAVSELSGRGVGLDIVRSSVQRVGGTVSLSSQPGLGTQLSLKLPVRISKERGLVLNIAGTLFALPSRSIIEMVRLRDQDVRAVSGGRALWSRFGVIPLRSLAHTLSFAEPQDEPHALVLSVGDQQLWAFAAARILGEYDLLRQPVDPLMSKIAPATASAILDDGRLVLWLSLADLVQLAESQQANPQPKRPTQEVPRHRILIVDDSAVIRALMAQVLASSGYDVTTAANGLEGLSVLERSTFSCVVLDVDMPEMDGFTLLERLRPRWPSLPVAMFTSNSSPMHRQRASALGANAYIVKSEFDESLLVGTVAKLIGAQL